MFWAFATQRGGDYVLRNPMVPLQRREEKHQ